MKRRFGIWSVIAALLGVLGISSAMLTLGQRDNIANPDAASTGPSGTAAFAELLRREGFQVDSLPGSRFALPRGTLALGFCTEPEPGLLLPGLEDMSLSRARSSIKEQLLIHFRQGGRALLITIPRDFQQASVAADLATLRVHADYANSSGDSQRTLEGQMAAAGERSGWASAFPWLDGDYLDGQVTDRGDAVLALYGVEKGVCGFVSSGIGATNRFLPTHDNAALFLGFVKLMAKPGSEIAFLEAAHGVDSEPSLVDILGPWAKALWWQGVALFALLFYTLGRRFGQPVSVRAREAGSSDLANALSGIMSRAKATDLAMGVLADWSDKAIRRHLKLPSEASKPARDERLPEKLTTALRDAELLAQQKAPRDEAVKVARRLEMEMQSFLSSQSQVKRPSG